MMIEDSRSMVQPVLLQEKSMELCEKGMEYEKKYHMEESYGRM